MPTSFSITAGQVQFAATSTKPEVADTPLALYWAGKVIFEMRKNGTITADWSAIMKLKDKLLANDCADTVELSVCTWAAALWLARNT